MGKLIRICCLLLCAWHYHALAAADTTLQLQLEKKVPGTFTNFFADNLGNLFLVSAGNQVKKLDHELDSAGIFNDVRRYGDIYSLDVNNPLKILIYYRNFTTIVTADRFLNIRNTIDLRTSGILQARAVAQSYDNNYWVFDELDNRLKKIDDNGKVLLESPDFRVLFSYNFTPQQIIDQDGALYLYDDKTGWMIFDYYGTFRQRIEAPGLRDVNVYRGNLTGRDTAMFHAIQPKTFSEMNIQVNISLAGVMKTQRQADRVLVLQHDGLYVYRIQ